MKYSRENAGGAIYTVDEVSGLLGIPRPTLYRYLREYSIPHLRQAGRISIPEDSFDRIREARDLHKEGLGTESVRRQVREGSAPDSGALDRRLDALHRTLEDLREDIKAGPATTGEVTLSPTLRTILARQSLLMSAVFNLTEMVEDLLLASGKPRKALFENLRAVEMQPERLPRDLLEIQDQSPVVTQTGPGTGRESVSLALEDRPTDFGSLRRRRRWGGLAVLMALLFAATLAWAIPAMISAGNAEPLVSRVASTANEPPDAPADPVPTVDSRIPDVSGRSLQEAVRIISDAGFEVADIRTEASQTDRDTAIRTEPTAGAPAKPGATVVLTMSGGAAPAAQTASATATATATATASASAGYAN